MTYFTYIFGRYYRWTFGQESDGIPWFMAETVGIGDFKMIQTWPSHFDIHMTLKHHIQTFLRFKHDVEYEEKETAKSGLAAVLGPISLFFALAAFPPPRCRWSHPEWRIETTSWKPVHSPQGSAWRRWATVSKILGCTPNPNCKKNGEKDDKTTLGFFGVPRVVRGTPQ